VSLRVYVSFGAELYTTTAPDGNPTSPSGWSPGDPVQGENYKVLWDFFELTWTRDDAATTALGANLTQLDFFGLPLQLDNYGYEPDLTTPVQLTTGFEGDARSAIVTSIQGLGEPWAALVVPDLNPSFPGIPLRVFSPYHGMELELFPKNQLETYVDHVWDYYTTQRLSVTVDGREYTGQVQGEGPNQGLFLFEPPAGSGLPPVLIQNPNQNHREGFVSGSKDVYECQVQLDVVPPEPLSSDAAQIARDLGASFLRSILAVGADLDRLPACDQVGQYYQHDPVDQYAAVMHEHAILSKAYAFGYDDVCEQSSVGITKNPTRLVLTVHAVTG
jgi:beta-galactosidase